MNMGLNQLQERFASLRPEPLSVSYWKSKNIRVSVLRTDKIHPLISGNKWFKLRYWLEKAKQENKTHIVTYGGAWSNHIHATAETCRQLSLKCTGIIRGEEPAVYSPTLQDAALAGMELIFSSRQDYKTKSAGYPLAENKEVLFIPEGGYGAAGAAGASTMLDYCEPQNFTHLCCAVGSGTMLAGLASRVSPEIQVTGISVLKNNHSLEAAVQELTTRPFSLLHDYCEGGYARRSPALIRFMNEFYAETGVPTDFVYTGKLFLAVDQLIQGNHFPEDSRILVIHSGGLQGNRSLPKGTLIF